MKKTALFALRNVALAAIFSSSVAFSANPTEREIYLTNFLQLMSENPQAALNENPPKFNSQGERIQTPLRNFSEKEVSTGSFVLRKDELRQKLCPAARPGQPCQALSGARNHSRLSILSAIDDQNEIQEFFAGLNVLRTLDQTQSIRNGDSAVAPWSGDYWATARGGIAFRYEDPNLPNMNKFREYANYLQRNRPHLGMSEELLNRLSPAEKYDLMMGDSQLGLTNWSVKSSLQSMKTDGTIEGWFGICHGWAPAAFMDPRPRKTVEVALRDPVTSKEARIKFYPDDLKALSSLAWANANYQSRMVGGRCNDKDPQRDSNGRIISSACFDVNPATWHLVALNQLGVQKRSMVIDATFDYEVWNQPVESFRVKYFNPLQRREFVSLDKARLNLSEYNQDPFKRYRNPEAVAVVGVVMDLTYLNENSASSREMDAEEYDSKTTVVYIYDLEINEQGEIIGGEWYQNAHPDFVWAPPVETKPLSREDQSLRGDWNNFAAPPAEWSSSAARSSIRGQPLYKVIQHLLEMAQ